MDLKKDIIHRDCTNINNLLKQYADELIDTLGDELPDMFNYVNNCIKGIDKTVREKSYLESPVFEFVDTVNLLSELTRQIHDILSKIGSTLTDYSSDVSMTKRLTSNAKLEKFDGDLYSSFNFIKDALFEFAELSSVDLVANVIKSKDQVLTLKEIYNSQKIYDNMIVYGHIVKKLNEVGVSKELRTFINLMNEKNKTDAIIISKSMKVKKIHSNPPLQTFGLYAIKLSMSLSEVAGFILGKRQVLRTGGSADSVFSSISKKNKIEIIFIKNISEPVEYYIQKLYSKSVSEIKSRAIDSKIISSLSLVKIIQERNRTKKKWEFSAKIFTPPGVPNNTVVIETIGAETYRILGQTGTGSQIPRIDPIRLTNLRTLVGNMLQVSERSRAYHLNFLETGKILPNLFTEKPIDITKVLEFSSLVEYRFLRYAVFSRIMDTYKKLDKKQTVDKFTFEGLIHNHSYDRILTDTIVEQYIQYSNNNLTDFQYRIGEKYITFISQLYLIKNMFSRELHNAYIKYDLPDIETINKFKRIDIFEQILEEALAKTFSDATNVFMDMVNKHNIFSVDI
jgi:hypothetical protein